MISCGHRVNRGLEWLAKECYAEGPLDNCLTGMNMKKNFGIGLMVAGLMASPVIAQDGAPDVKQEVRDVAAVKVLNSEEDVSLLYVKGMT